MRHHVLFLALITCAITSATGQASPESNKGGSRVPCAVQTLEGKLVFHDGIRKWFELKLDQQQCGQSSIQLVRLVRDWTPIEILRGCLVKSHGRIDLAATGYYSLALYQEVQAIESVGQCKRQPPFQDYSQAKPDRTIRFYRVDMHVDYAPGDHPILFSVSSENKELRPWQAYASYDLTGGFVLYGHCGQGFVIDKVYGTPEANPSHFTESRDPGDMAMFDPESAAAAGTKDLHLGYTCMRIR